MAVGARRVVGEAVDDRDLTDPQPVPVAQTPAALDALAVDERPVLGEPVVDDRPIGPDPLEHRVDAGHLVVPCKRDVGGLVAADDDRARLLAELEGLAGAKVVLVDECRTLHHGETVNQIPPPAFLTVSLKKVIG